MFETCALPYKVTLSGKINVQTHQVFEAGFTVLFCQSTICDSFRYYSMYGHVEKLAEEIKKGASSLEGVEAKLWQVMLSLKKL